MARVDYGELYAQRHMSAKVFKLDQVNMDFHTTSYTDPKELDLQNALSWFAAGYEDALAVYLNLDGAAGGAHYIGEELGMNVNYARIANLYLEIMKLYNPDPIEDKYLYEIYCERIKTYIDKAREHNQMEYEYFEAEYLLLCGKREEAKAAFLDIYKGKKPFGYYAEKRLNEMYFQDHPEEKKIPEKNAVEECGGSRSFAVIVWLLAIFLLGIVPLISLALIIIFFVAKRANKHYYEKVEAVAMKKHYDEEMNSLDYGTYTWVFNPYAKETFKKNIFKERPCKDDRSSYSKTVQHENSYQESDGTWTTFRYQTEEVDWSQVQYAQDKQDMISLKWHDGVRETVRTHRIENWKRLKARVDQGDKMAEMLMDAMGFNREHHNNGVAQIRTRDAKFYEFFSLNAMASWAPFEVID